ncbi:hypothetical protein M514_23608 [Trichuris suis]|uniref:Uncharacterized protein n=1 Tax=Trichuris suis TaxID=68888 RepID=A0A085N416_9BILA|nr:hypothetical protein M514_23608 [Trichuris suis]
MRQLDLRQRQPLPQSQSALYSCSPQNAIGKTVKWRLTNSECLRAFYVDYVPSDVRLLMIMLKGEARTGGRFTTLLTNASWFDYVTFTRSSCWTLPLAPIVPFAFGQRRSTEQRCRMPHFLVLMAIILRDISSHFLMRVCNRKK